MTLKPGVDDTEWAGFCHLARKTSRSRLDNSRPSFVRSVEVARIWSLPRLLGRLVTALDAVVQHGTAASIKDSLANTAWRIGGKTGTGPGDCGDHCDGWFASLVSDHHGVRYVILVFIRGKGLGGGVAAHSSASLAEYLAAAHNSPVQ